MSFVDKVVLVTGAGSGIGKSVATSFAKEGADLIIVDRNGETLNKVAQELEQSGRKPLAVKADISNDEDVKAMVRKAVDTYGKLDVLVNNAGMVRMETLLGENIMKAFDETMQTNLRAVVLIISLAAPHIVKTKGNIVNISSVSSLYVPKRPGYLSYIVSKAGLDHFTRGVALELAEYGVRVNCINPGFVKSSFITNNGIIEADSPEFWESAKYTNPLRRVTDPQEIAELVLFLASDKARSITGSSYVNDCGMLLSQF